MQRNEFVTTKKLGDGEERSCNVRGPTRNCRRVYITVKKDMQIKPPSGLDESVHQVKTTSKYKEEA